MPTAAINGTTIWYEIEGEGPPLLVLHGGLGIDHGLYQATLTPLAERLQLVYLDHRGNGRSGRPPIDTITIEQLADDAAGLAAHLGHPRVIAFGHSYGGFVAQELALRHPELVAALVLADTSPGQLGTTEGPDDPQGPSPPPEVLEIVTMVPRTDAELADGMARLFPYYLHRRDFADIEPILASVIFDAKAMVRGFEVLAGWSSVDRLPAITAPTLVLVGRHDRFTSPPQARRIASRIEGAHLVVLEEAGHIPWLDEPEKFFTTVSRWIHRLAERGGGRPSRRSRR